MSNQFVRDTCMLIRHDAAAYHEDGWKRKAAMALGGAAAIGAAGYLGGTKRGRGQVRQAAGYVKRKAGSAYGAAKQGVGQVRQKAGAAYGAARKKAGDMAFHMSPKGTTRQTSLF